MRWISQAFWFMGKMWKTNCLRLGSKLGIEGRQGTWLEQLLQSSQSVEPDFWLLGSRVSGYV